MVRVRYRKSAIFQNNQNVLVTFLVLLYKRVRLVSYILFYLHGCRYQPTSRWVLFFILLIWYHTSFRLSSWGKLNWWKFVMLPNHFGCRMFVVVDFFLSGTKTSFGWFWVSRKNVATSFQGSSGLDLFPTDRGMSRRDPLPLSHFINPQEQKAATVRIVDWLYCEVY